jgi:hypothetical protein
MDGVFAGKRPQSLRTCSNSTILFSKPSLSLPPNIEKASRINPVIRREYEALHQQQLLFCRILAPLACDPQQMDYKIHVRKKMAAPTKTLLPVANFQILLPESSRKFVCLSCQFRI